MNKSTAITAEVQARVDAEIAKTDGMDENGLICRAYNCGFFQVKGQTREFIIAGIRKELTRIYSGDIPKANVSIDRAIARSMNDHNFYGKK